MKQNNNEKTKIIISLDSCVKTLVSCREVFISNVILKVASTCYYQMNGWASYYFLFVIE